MYLETASLALDRQIKKKSVTKTPANIKREKITIHMLYFSMKIRDF